MGKVHANVFHVKKEIQIIHKYEKKVSPGYHIKKFKLKPGATLANIYR